MNYTELSFSCDNYAVSQLEGEILTQIDASIIDPIQRKAQKDIFRKMLWDWVYRMTPRGDASSSSGKITVNGS